MKKNNIRNLSLIALGTTLTVCLAYNLVKNKKIYSKLECKIEEEREDMPKRHYIKLDNK